MSRAVDILINGVDNFSETAEDAEKSGQQLAKELDSAFNKVALAVLGATTALEVMNREQRGMRETLERTAYFLDTNSESLRELAVNISNVTRPTEDVVKGFRALMQRGIQNEEHLARLAIQYDTLADAMGENMLPVIEQVIPMFAAFGDNAGGVERYGDKLVHTFEATSLELADFNRVMRRSRIYLTNMGLTMDDAIAVLYGLGESSKNSAQAMYTLQRAARRADGDFDKFLEIAGLTKEELGEYKEILEDTEGTMQDFADIHEDSYTPIQRLLSIVERLKLRYGETIETLGSLMTAVAIVIGGLWALSTLTNSLAANVWLAHKAFVALAGFMGTSVAVVFGWTAGIIALAAGFTYLAETMTDDIAVMERKMERLEGTINSISKIVAGELGDSWESIADVPEQVIDQWEKNIKKGLDVDVDIREDFDTFQSLKAFLEQGVASLETEIMNTDDVGGVISQAITNGLEKVKPAVDKAIIGLEDWLFDTLEAMDFEAFVGEDGEVGEILEGLGTETTLTDGLTAGDIDGIMSEVQRKLSNVDEQLEAGLLGSQFEVLEGYAEATKSGLEELLSGGLEPTSDEVQKLFTDFVDFTSQMDSGAEKAEYLNEAFIGLLDSGITPNTKGYDKLKKAVIAANSAIDDSEPDEQIKKRDEIIKAYQQEIENIELLADKKEEMGQSYDEEAEKLKVYENALQQLIPLYGVSEQEVEKLMAQISNLSEEEETLAQSMQKARTEIALLTKLDKELGDSLDLTSDRTSTAQSAIDRLTAAWIAGDITLEEFKKEVKYFNDILDSAKVDYYADSIEELNTQLKNINEMERVGVLDEAEADQRRLNNVNRQMELMVNNQEHINEETGEVTQAFKDLLVEAGLLEEKLDQSKGNVEEIGHSWRRVLDVIGQNVSAVGAFQETIENIKDTGFNFSDIELPEGMDLGIDLGGIGEKISSVFSKVSDKLGSFIGKAGTFLSVIMPMLKESEYFGKVMESLGRIMQPVVEIFGIILEVLYPFIRIIEITLVPILRAFGAIIRALIIPVFRALFPVIKMFGVVITSVAEVIAKVVGIFSSSARRFAKEMAKARKELLDLSWDDLQKEMRSTADGMSKVNEELHNIPSGFKLNLERFNAIKPGTPPMEEASDQMDYGDMEDSWDESGEMVEEGGIDLSDTLLTVGGLILLSGESVSDSLDSVGSWIVSGGRYLWDGLRNVGSWVMSGGRNLWDGLKRVGSWIVNGGRGLWNNLKSVGSWVLSGGKSLFDTLVSVAGSLFRAGDGLVSVVAEIAGSLLSGSGGLFGGIFGAIGSFFGGIFHGGGKVPGKKGEEKMILAQAGEMVIPLDMVEQLEKKERGLASIAGTSVEKLTSKSVSNSSKSPQNIVSETQDNRQTNNHYHYNFDNVEIVSDNPEEIWRQLKRIMKRENYEKTGSTLRRDNRYA